MNYSEFINSKTAVSPSTGISGEIKISDKLFPFQKATVEWALKRGRAAIWADCGLGKTPMQLEWARQVYEYTKQDIIIFAPLAVAQQTIKEGKKFGIKVTYARCMEQVKPGITVTNYEMLEYFDPSHFGAVVLDESSILKSYTGKFRTEIIHRFNRTPFRLACTATPSPNDYMELGNHAEFLGVLSRVEMLSTYFIHDGGETSKWRLKGHAQDPFWKWLSSWAVVIRKPSDIGFSDDGFNLPPLNIERHILHTDKPTPGYLFSVPAETLSDQRTLKRGTIDDRIKKCCQLIYKYLDLTGNTYAKLCTCGKNDTESLDGTDTKKTPRNASGEKSNAVLQKKTKNICSPTTEKIRESSRNTPNAIGNELTNGNAKNIGQIKFIEKKSKTDPANGGNYLNAPNDSETTSELHPPITKICSLLNQEDALSVLQRSVTVPEGDYISTIATKPGKSGVCYVHPATLDLESSETTKNFSDAPWIIWCQLNDEQHQLEALFGNLAVSIEGATPLEEKESRINSWLSGEVPIIISKASILGWGLNFQNCPNQIFISLSHSYEEYYQAVRRCWRFGQKKPVNVHQILMDSEQPIIQNLQRKQAEADRMAAEMVVHMKSSMKENLRGTTRQSAGYEAKEKIKIPSWVGE